MADKRVQIDCRTAGKDCSLRVEGTESEVIETMVPHVVKRHGMQDTEDTRKQLRSMERPA